MKRRLARDSRSDHITLLRAYEVQYYDAWHYVDPLPSLGLINDTDERSS